MTVSITTDSQNYSLASGQTVTSAGSLDVIRSAIRVDAQNVGLNIAGTVNGGSDAGILLDTGPRVTNPDPYAGASVFFYFYDRSSMAVNIAAGGVVSGYYGIYVKINPLNLETTGEGGNSRATVDNSGSIQAQSGGYALYSGLETAEAYQWPKAAFASVINRAGGFIGAIQANVETLSNAGTIDGGGRLALNLLGSSIIDNSGTITGGIAGDSRLGSAAAGARLYITNSATGVISGGFNAISAGFGGLELFNAGTINGNVSAPTPQGGGGNIIDNGQGTINGSVTMYAGNDLFIGRMAANGTLISGATGSLDAGAGIDTFAAAVSGTRTLSMSDVPTGFERLRLDLATGANLTISPGSTTISLLLSGRATVANAANITSNGVALGYDIVQLNTPGSLYRLAISNSGTLVATYDAGNDPNYGAAVMFRHPDAGTTGPMATSFTNTGSITAVVARGVALSLGDTPQATFANSGTITAADARAVDVLMAGTSSNQFVNSGTINGATSVTFLTSPAGTPNVATNTGLMQANGAVIGITGGSFTNQGNIVSTGNGIYAAVSHVGTGLAGPSLENTGIIASAGTGAAISEARLINQGSIISSQKAGVILGYGAVAIDNLAGAVIRGGNGVAIALSVYSSYGAVTITNAGLIDGRIDLDGISSTPGFQLTNSGVINGSVLLGYSDDSFDGTLGLQQDVRGGFGNDSLKGGNGNDLFYGDWGDDLLDGGAGADVLIGGAGSDVYFVDSQADVIIELADEGFDAVFSSVSFYLYANIDQLSLEGVGDYFGVGNTLANTIIGNDGSNLLLGGGGDDAMSGGAGNDSMFGEAGNDSVFGDDGVDYIVGGAGDDELRGLDDADALYGEAGDDYLEGGRDFATDILVGGAGNDFLDGESGLGDYDLMDGGAGDDIYYVDTPNDLTFEAVGGGTDRVFANIVGAGYYLYSNVEDLTLLGNTPFGVGNELNNRLTGNTIANYLLGGLGDDTLNGKGGNDVLFGEGGADTFIFQRGTGGDVIGDFQAGVDKIRLEGLGFSSFAQVQANMVQNGGTTAINLGLGDFIVLNGVTNAQLTAVDFIFG